MDNPYPICKNCIFVDEPLDKDPCQDCHRTFLAQRIKPNFVSKHKPKTNADRIRRMTDEELADNMLDMFAAFYDVEWSKEAVLEWLKQETTNES